MEADVWKTQPPNKIGRPVQPPCISETAWTWNEEFSFFEAETTCSPQAQWAQEEAQGRHDQFLFPAGVAVYEPTAGSIARGFPTTRRVLVADRYNHRMLVFLPGPNGTWLPLDQAVPGDVAAAHWNGFQMPSAPWPVEFDGLVYPEHLTVDRAGFVWIANLAKCRIEVFTPTGRFQGAVQLSETCDYLGSVGLFPYGVAVNDDAEYGVAGRVAVVAQDYATQGSQVIVLNAATGAVVGRHAPDPFVGQLDDPGAFNHATAIDYLRVGGVDRLVVADTENNRVQVFDTEAATELNAGAPKSVPVLMFGATELIDPTTGQPISESRLQWPYSLHVDARGRLLVSDSIGNRETFFTLDFSAQPTAKFLFELNARGGLNGVPRGVAEDSDHSLYIVDTGNHEVEVFEIPALAIVDVGTLPPAPRVNNTIHVDFTVLVPETKSTVPNVTTTCDVLSGGMTLQAGPMPMDGTAAGAIDMMPVPAGGVHRYRCDFRATSAGPFEVSVGAQGGPTGTEVTAPSKIASGTIADCAGPCEGDPPTIAAVVTDPAPVNNFYPHDATITLTATDAGTGDVAPSGIKRIYWKWVSSSAMSQLAVDPLFACPGQPTPTQCVDYATSAPAQSVAVMATAEGLSTLEFWTEDFHGNISAHDRLPIAIDTIAPMITASLRTASTSGNSGWFNADVFIDLTFSDPLGLTQPSQVVTTPPDTHALRFASEGRNLEQSIIATDLAGNSESFVSTSLVTVLNIDKSAPHTTAASTLGLLTDNQVFLQSQPPVVSFTAIDPQLSTGEDGSGVTYTGLKLDGGPKQPLTPGLTISAPALGPHSIEYWSKDQAGNEEPHVTRMFYVNALPVATPDTATTNEDTTVSINVLANDTDGNDRATDPFTVTIVTASNGTALVQPNQSVTFAPQPDFSGAAAFTYQVSDAHGGTATATVTVTVISTNVPPVAVNDVIPLMLDGSPAIQFNVLTNDTDADGDVLSLASWTPLTPSIGTLASLGNGLFSFTPPTSVGIAPVTATFTYVVRDAAGAPATGTVTLTVKPGNRAPVCDSAYGGEIWPPNHKTFEVARINGVTDPDGHAVTLQITKIMQNEPTDTTGDGSFSPDASGIGTASAWVRAERMGSGNGRVYRISFEATDALGGSCTGSVDYLVPHDRGKKSNSIAGTKWYDATVHVPGTRDK